MEKRSHLQIRIALLLRHRTLSEGVLSPSLLQLKSIDSYLRKYVLLPRSHGLVRWLTDSWKYGDSSAPDGSVTVLIEEKNRRRASIYYGVPGPMEFLYSRRMHGYCWQSVFALLGPVRAPLQDSHGDFGSPQTAAVVRSLFGGQCGWVFRCFFPRPIYPILSPSLPTIRPTLVAFPFLCRIRRPKELAIIKVLSTPAT